MSDQEIKILLIEDDTILRTTLIELLTERDYYVEGVPSSDQALTIAQKTEFDLVITDIRTEGKHDGLSTLEQVKEQQPDVAAVVITGYSTEDYALRAVKLKVEDYLKKPFQLADFLQRVDSIASRKRRLKAEAEEKASVRQTILWFTEQLARTIEPEEDFDSDLYFKKVDLLCLGSDLDRATCDEIKIAASLSLSSESNDMELPSHVHRTLPSSVHQILRHRAENWDGSGEPGGLESNKIPLGSRIVRYAFEAASHKDLDSLQLEEKLAGQLDPVLVQLDSKKETTEGAQNLHAASRSLLALGATLEDVGQTDEALRTYELLVTSHESSRYAVQALLGKSRIYYERGQSQDAKSTARRAAELARRHGPGTLAAVSLESGILLSRLSEPDGHSILLEAGTQLQQIRDKAGRAISVLALAHFWKEDGPLEAALRTLLSTHFTSEFVNSASWIIPFALSWEKLNEGLTRETLKKAAMDCPGILVRSCRDFDLPAKARLLALESLEGSLSTSQLQGLIKDLGSDPLSDVRTAAQTILKGLRPTDTQLPTLRLFTLGGVRVFRDEERLDQSWRRKKPQHFLAYLLGFGDRSLSDDSLVEVFWPGPLDKGRASLRAALSYLRRQMVPKDMAGDLNYFLKPPGLVKLNPNLPTWFDLTEFDRAVAHLRKHRGGSKQDLAVAEARRVSTLYTGPFLEECYMDWAVRIRERTDTAATEAMGFLMDWYYRSERYDEALEFGIRAVEIDPTSEQAQGGLIRTYLAQDRSNDALRQFERCEAALREELDLEPSRDLQLLKEQALRSTGS